MQITKKQIASLIDEVVLQYQNRYLQKYIKEDRIKFRHDVLITNFAVMFFEKDERYLHKNFIDLLDFYKELQIPRNEVKYALAEFFRIYEKWVVQYGVVKDVYFQKVKEIYVALFQGYDFEDSFDEELDAEAEDDAFFFVADEGVDEAIDSMHYSDPQKISAVDYFTQYPLEAEDIEDIVVIRDTLIEILDSYDDFDERFLEEFTLAISKLITTLQFALGTKEFEDIGIALNKLVDIMTGLVVPMEMEELAYNLLVSFLQDLIKWIDTLFIEQSAVDIHYLDASLFSNITQFEMLFNKKSEAQEESMDDDFLF